MNPNIYDLLALQNQVPQMGPGGAMPGLMVQGIPQDAPQVAGVDQNSMLNPNSSQVTPKKSPIANKLGLAPDTGANAPSEATPAQPSIMELLRQKVNEANGTTQASIKQIEDQANALRNKPAQTDWSALLGLTDSWTGSNLGKFYQKPMTDQERAQQLLDLQTKLLGAKDKLADNDVNMLKTQLQDQRDQQRMAHETQQEKIRWAALSNANDKSAGKLSLDDEKQIKKFSSEVMNPSTRSKLGTYQKIIDSASSIQTLADTYAGGLPANASYDQKAAAYDNMTVQQAEEVTKSLDGLLSRGSPTISGQDHLRFSTLRSKLQDIKAKLGNSPQPAHLGAFIAQAMDTVEREKKLYNNMKNQTHAGLKEGIPGLVQRHGDTIDKILNHAAYDEMSAPAEAGPSADEHAQAIAWAQAHPNDPRSATILGGK